MRIAPEGENDKEMGFSFNHYLGIIIFQIYNADKIENATWRTEGACGMVLGFYIRSKLKAPLGVYMFYLINVDRKSQNYTKRALSAH